MAVVVSGDTSAKLQVDYEFQFVIRNYKAVEEAELNNSYYHDEDCWQLELKRVEGNNESQPQYNWKLRLVSSSSQWKIVGVDCQMECNDKGVDNKQKVEKMATLFRSGWEFDIGTFPIDQCDLKMIHVEVLSSSVAMPDPKRDILLDESSDEADEFSDEVLKWFEAEDFGDATIVGADGKKLRCHRDVLARRCEVLDLMFSYAMKDSGQNVINIKNFNEEVISRLLLFIYTDNVVDMWPFADDLFVAADEYQLERLKKLCETNLADNLDDEDVMKTLQLADHYHLTDLMGKCVDYLSMNKCGRFKPSPIRGWPESIRPIVADPKGLRITSRTTSLYGRQYSEKGFPINHNFTVTFNNHSSLEEGEVVFSDSFTRNGDLWQLELKRSGQSKVECKLHLVDTSNDDLKMACIEQRFVKRQRSYDDYDYDDSPEREIEIKTTRLAVFKHSGDSCDFFTLTVGSDLNKAKLKVQLIKWQFAQSEQEPPNTPMASMLLNWFQTEQFGDITIVAADGKKFGCHRDILARRCEVLKLKINSTMEEAGKCVINSETTEPSNAKIPLVLSMEDFEGDVVTQLLLFIYTDDCGNVGPIADRLWFAARHYRLERLQNLCESALATSLSTKSFVKFYRMANTYRLDKLMAICVDFLESHKAVLPVSKLFAEAIKVEEEPKAKRPRLE